MLPYNSSKARIQVPAGSRLLQYSIQYLLLLSIVYMATIVAHCLRLVWQAAPRAWERALDKAGINKANNRAMTEITTSNSIRVKAPRFFMVTSFVAVAA
ncbi:hypothetical protein ES703_95422 [subsurface metagenome]